MVKHGDRRGRYASTAERVVLMSSEWDPEDIAEFKRLIADSPLQSEVAKEHLARVIIEARRALRQLDAMPAKNADEHRAANGYMTTIRKALEQLKVAERVKEDEEEL